MKFVFRQNWSMVLSGYKYKFVLGDENIGKAYRIDVSSMPELVLVSYQILDNGSVMKQALSHFKNDATTQMNGLGFFVKKKLNHVFLRKFNSSDFDERVMKILQQNSQALIIKNIGL